MKIDRRAFLQISIGGALCSYFGYRLFHIFWPDHLTDHEKKTLSSYLDTLIPQDLMPSATQVGVPEHIIRGAKRDNRYRRLLKEGCRWLDTMAGREGAANFFSLDEGGRIKIVALAEAGEKGSLPYGFFFQTRYDAYHFYYGNPKSWKGLGYHGPPQPEGFPDYDIPPGVKT